MEGCSSDRFKSLNCCTISQPEELPVSSWVRHLTFGSAGLWFNTAGGFVSLHLGQWNTSDGKASKSARWDKRMSWPSVTFQNEPSGHELPVGPVHVDVQPADGRIASLWARPSSCGLGACLPALALSHPSSVPLHRQQRKNKADSQCCCSHSLIIKCSPRLKEIELH